jgi:hypothetical protein
VIAGVSFGRLPETPARRLRIVRLPAAWVDAAASRAFELFVIISMEPWAP